MRISIRTAAMVLLLAVLPFVPNAVCDPVPRVWMLPFHNTVMNSSASSLTQTIPDLLQVFFSQSAQYAVVDRDHLEMILAERSLTWHGLVSSAQRAEIGTLLGATMMLSGSFVVQGEQVRVTAHAYEMQTSRLLASSQGTGRFDDLAGLVSHIYRDLAAAIGKAVGSKVDLPVDEAPISNLHFMRGLSYYYAGRYALALAEFIEAATGPQESPLYRLWMANCYLAQGQYGHAYIELKKLSRGKESMLDLEDVTRKLDDCRTHLSADEMAIFDELIVPGRG